MTNLCLSTNKDLDAFGNTKAGAAYGYVGMGGWNGGQADYVMVPYADWNLLKFQDREGALDKLRDLATLSDIFPTGFHGAVTAGVGVGSTVYVAGAGPVGLAAAASAKLLGAAVVFVGDLNKERLAHAKKTIGCEVIDVSKAPVHEQIAAALKTPYVDCSVDAVGFEARGGHGQTHIEKPAQVLNDLMQITAPGGAIGIPGLYVTADPGAVDDAAKEGTLSMRLGLGWSKGHSFFTGQCPVMRYNRQLARAIMHDRVNIAEVVNVQVISLEDAPKGYADFDKGAAKKFVIDPSGDLRKRYGIKSQI